MQARTWQLRSEPTLSGIDGVAQTEYPSRSQVQEMAAAEAFARKLRGGPQPPGLEGMGPNEYLTPSLTQALSPRTLASSLGLVKPGAAAQMPLQPGLWMNAAMALRPHLNTEGIRKALAIVDRAAKNIEYAKALDELIGSAGQLRFDPDSYGRSAMHLRVQIDVEQLQLLTELEDLRAQHGKPRAATVAAAAEAPSARTPTACPTSGKKPAKEEAQRHTLTWSMQSLSREDPDTLFIVRHITKLGYRAQRKLKKHFSAYGTVARVLVVNSTVRQHGSADCEFRQRPSSLGFVQMASKEAVNAILAAGLEQEVAGTIIRLEKFGKQQAKAISGEQVESRAACAFERYTSTGSVGSMASASTCIPDDIFNSKWPVVGSTAADEDSA